MIITNVTALNILDVWQY